MGRPFVTRMGPPCLRQTHHATSGSVDCNAADDINDGSLCCKIVNWMRPVDIWVHTVCAKLIMHLADPWIAMLL
eukprot:2353877-Prorocentrum_lima.AAC.1